MTRSLVAFAVVFLGLGCASELPEPVSALRRDAASAAATGSDRFAGRHYKASAESFGRAAAIYAALDDTYAEAKARRNQAEALRRAGRFEEAAAGFERALVLDREGGWQGEQARDLAGLARCRYALGNTELAIEQAETALTLASGTDASVEIDLAVYLIARGDPADEPRVLAMLTSLAERDAEGGEPRTRAAANYHLGRAYRAFGSPERAETSLRLAMDQFRALDDPEGLARTHEELGRLLEERNDVEGARRHFYRARLGYEFLGDESALARVDDLLEEGLN